MNNMNIHEIDIPELCMYIHIILIGISYMLICPCICSSQGSEVTCWQWPPFQAFCDRASATTKNIVHVCAHKMRRHIAKWFNKQRQEAAIHSITIYVYTCYMTITCIYILLVDL